jgi:G patch domain-containing protein 1
LSKDALPRKKPYSLKDQVATDKYGRRRFHGAFTGGFSAGFFNSVGSLEGWTPSAFKSSRSDKAKEMQQKPEDYMDEEVIIRLICLVCTNNALKSSVAFTHIKIEL